MVTTIVSFVTIGATGVALADVGIPYTFTIDYISGGSGGVSTPKFWTNNLGQICIKPDLHVSQNASAGASANDNFYQTLIVRNDLFGDTVVQTWDWNTATDNWKRCRSGLATNSDFHVTIKKTKFVDGQLLAGSDVISCS